MYILSGHVRYNEACCKNNLLIITYSFLVVCFCCVLTFSFVFFSRYRSFAVFHSWRAADLQRVVLERLLSVAVKYQGYLRKSHFLHIYLFLYTFMNLLIINSMNDFRVLHFNSVCMNKVRL